MQRQEMRRALGLPDEEVDVESPSEFLLTAIVFAVLPNLEGAAGDIGVSLEGAPVPPWRYDLAAGSGAPSERPSDAAARIAGPAPSFIMAAAGRDTFDALRLDGLLEVEGDREFAARFLATLRVV